jgi:DNA-binding NarL/FixJ family response regulator
MRLPESELGDQRLGKHAVVVMDRQPLWLLAVAEVLERAGFTVLGTTTSEAKALQLVRQHQPDVVIFEPEACSSSTARFVAAARLARPQLKAVAVSSVEDSDAIRSVLQSGVWAYVLKRAQAGDIAVAVRQAFAHSIHLADALDRSEMTPTRASRPDGASLGLLTRREREILALVAEGHSNAAMARRLWVTEQTVKFHLSNVYRKLGVANRTAATRWAHDHGLVAAHSATS